MAFQLASVTASHDPRAHLSEKEEEEAYVPEDNVLPDGSTPNIETYMYYAKIQRDKEAALAASEDVEGGWGSLISRTFHRSQGSDKNSVVSALRDSDEKRQAISEEGGSVLVTASEHRAASSALRTATWGSVFYLITTGMLTAMMVLTYAHLSIRHFGSLFYAMGVSTSWIWSRCRLLLCLRYYGCIQWLHPVVAVYETGLGEVPR